jgi:hypothetical protein
MRKEVNVSPSQAEIFAAIAREQFERNGKHQAPYFFCLRARASKNSRANSAGWLLNPM